VRRRLAWLGVSGALLVCGLGAAVVACGSDAALTGDEADGGFDGATTAPPNGTGGGGSGSGALDGGAADGGEDAGADGAVGDATASNPNNIVCGAHLCNADTEICCKTFNDAGCQAPGSNCQGTTAECDEAADCSGAQVCCAAALGQGSASCRNNCTGQERQLCKTNAECSNGTCYTNRCVGGTVIQSCSQLPACTQ
jgi:hypothetical protein